MASPRRVSPTPRPQSPPRSPSRLAPREFICRGHNSLVVGYPAGFCATCARQGPSDGPLCDVCLDMHATGRIPGHAFTATDPSSAVLVKFGGATPTFTRCRRHTHREVELKCLDCVGGPLICSMCRPSHDGHRLVWISDEAATERRRVEAALALDVGGAGAFGDGAQPPFVAAASARALAVAAEALALQASLDAANARADELLEAGVSALMARHAEWRAGIDALGAARLRGLETKQAAADVGAAEAAAVAADVRRALLVLRDVDIVTHAPALVGRVQAAQARVAAAGPPVTAGAPVDVSLLELVADPAPMLAAIAGLGALEAAQFALTVDDPCSAVLPPPPASQPPSPPEGRADGIAAASAAAWAGGAAVAGGVALSSPSSPAPPSSSPRRQAAPLSAGEGGGGSSSGRSSSRGIGAFHIASSPGVRPSGMQSPRLSVRLLEDGGLSGQSPRPVVSSPAPQAVPAPPPQRSPSPSPLSSRRQRSPSPPAVPRVPIERIAAATAAAAAAATASAAPPPLPPPPLSAHPPAAHATEPQSLWPPGDPDAAAASASSRLIAAAAAAAGPLRFEGVVSGEWGKACVTGGGAVFVAQEGSSVVHAFAANGAPLAPLPVAALGLSAHTSAVAFDDDSETLLLADSNGASSRVVAIDAASRALRWSSTPGSLGNCSDVAVLADQGLVLVACPPTHKIHVLRIADGVRMPSILAQFPTSLAVDASSATVFCSAKSQGAFVVSAWRWDPPSRAFVPQGHVKAAGRTVRGHRLAVVPQRPGSTSAAYLVVGEGGSPTLRMLSLPGRAHAHTHTLHGVEVAGLGAGPHGTTLAVCDTAVRAATVLPWPLPPSHWQP